MALFAPDLVMFGDQAGFGLWTTGHYYEHQQFVRLGLGQTPKKTFPDFDLWFWPDNKQAQLAWISVHGTIHDVLQAVTGVNGFDYYDLDPGNAQSWDLWQQAHRQEHINLRAAFGVT